MDIVINEDQSKFLNTLWTRNEFSNLEKTFFLKLHNNTLGYNNAVSHFVRGHSPTCTFCSVARIPDPNVENGSHLFFECDMISDMVGQVFQRVTGENDFQINKREFLQHLKGENMAMQKI
jgi:hypothetical protein